MQIAGRASVMGSDRTCDFAARLPDFRELLVKYKQFLLSQVQRTAACNAVHGVQAPPACGLCGLHDLAGVDLPLTQEFLAQMIGVRRTSVTDVASELQKAGMISYSRGRIHIENIGQIRASACECDSDIW
jgi:CRP-like cAMP-binding protein